MDKKKLNAKDFINIGIFTVIYFVMFFITGMLGYIPIFAVIIPMVLGILGGIPFMLFLTKTGKFGAATIMGTLVSVLCFLMGQSWISIPFGIVLGFLADLIFKAGEYKSWKHDLSAAALTRGLGNGKKRTSICKIGFHWKDFALMIIVTAALLVFLLF